MPECVLDIENIVKNKTEKVQALIKIRIRIINKYGKCSCRKSYGGT